MDFLDQLRKRWRVFDYDWFEDEDREEKRFPHWESVF